MYADDTNLLKSVSRLDYNRVNVELDKVYQWLCANRLSLNVNKTTCMVFHNKNKVIDPIPHIQILNHTVDRVPNFNFLGVTLNENLNWKDQIDIISNKIVRCIRTLCRLKHYLPSFILKLLYNSLILPHLTYGILAWGTCSTCLYRLQKKAIY